MPLNVTIFNEFIHERNKEEVRAIYPDGIHATLAAVLSRESDIVVKTATLEEPEHGLTEERLADTDVLIWWGHTAHDKVSDTVADRVQQRVLDGMGLIVLHSGHHAKVFKRLMGTTCNLTWREAGEKERLWVVDPSHPIAAGIDRYFEIPATEMYGEFFDIAQPDELIFISWFTGGEVFRSGATWRRGRGRIFYFRPGHETFPIYHQQDVQRVIVNGVRWAAFDGNRAVDTIASAVNVPVSPEAASSQAEAAD